MKQVLGKGSTSRALLVSKPDEPDAQPRVFKVALNEAAARRLDREAAQLAQLTDSHVARLLNQPFDAGPAGTSARSSAWSTSGATRSPKSCAGTAR